MRIAMLVLALSSAVVSYAGPWDHSQDYGSWEREYESRQRCMSVCENSCNSVWRVCEKSHERHTGRIGSPSCRDDYYSCIKDCRLSCY